ncbi:MAG TPA: glycoside hydrolase family 127 protein [Rhizomicrobium sp.]
MGRPIYLSRRLLLGGTASLGVAAAAGRSAIAATVDADFPEHADPFALEDVRLLPSPYLSAVETNLTYLHRLEPDRLLHNFRSGAGLTPKGAVYGGWESDTIAGHTLGHYLSACSLMFAQTGDAECKRRVDYIVDELAACQAAQGDGYVAGFTRKRGDIVEDGKVIFAELKRGDIRVLPFDLNGCWVPLYNFHKTFAGLFEAHRHCANKKALAVALGLAGYIDGVFSGLSDAQVQAILDCEHGGLNESFAELYARTGDVRWRDLANRIYHRKTLDPLAGQRDELQDLHANTQIPKLIGLARLYEVGGDTRHAAAASFFWRAVTQDHSYVIGGNGDREYFTAPKTISKYITEQTCESCNSYNMLKLTRHMFGWTPDASYFDYYERAHLNHVLAQHNPDTSMFSYMVPLMAGSHREFSTPFADFWCCMGTGMESHSKHGDSIYWHGGDTLFVNLFIPSRLNWRARGARIELTTSYPFSENVTLRMTSLRRPQRFALAMRLPGWCKDPSLRVNGDSVPIERRNGYAIIRRSWKTGDAVALVLPMPLRSEPTPDDPQTAAYLKGPMVLAANLGPSTAAYAGPAPAIVAMNPLAGIQEDITDPAVFRTVGTGRPADLTLEPFFRQYERNTAVYFKHFTEPEWAAAEAASAAQAGALKALDARSVDVAKLGDDDDEKSHKLESKISYAVVYRGRKGRDARTGGYFSVRMKTAKGPLVLRATYSGDDRKRLFYILVDGTRVATQALEAERRGGFVDREYAIPEALTAGKSTINIRVEPEPGHSAGPVFGFRLLPKDGDTI